MMCAVRPFTAILAAHDAAETCLSPRGARLRKLAALETTFLRALRKRNRSNF
jgi:hypothetical protein